MKLRSLRGQGEEKYFSPADFIEVDT